jgi:hypothetical protein
MFNSGLPPFPLFGLFSAILPLSAFRYKRKVAFNSGLPAKMNKIQMLIMKHIQWNAKIIAVRIFKISPTGSDEF